MSEVRIPKKNEALIELRKAVTLCPECGEAFDGVNANSHQATSDPESLRFYFQFLHGDDECIVYTPAVDFRDWLARVTA